MQQNGEISLYADKIYYFSAKKEGKKLGAKRV